VVQPSQDRYCDDAPGSTWPRRRSVSRRRGFLADALVRPGSVEV